MGAKRVFGVYILLKTNHAGSATAALATERLIVHVPLQEDPKTKPEKTVYLI